MTSLLKSIADETRDEHVAYIIENDEHIRHECNEWQNHSYSVINCESNLIGSESSFDGEYSLTPTVNIAAHITPSFDPVATQATEQQSTKHISRTKSHVISDLPVSSAVTTTTGLISVINASPVSLHASSTTPNVSTTVPTSHKHPLWDVIRRQKQAAESSTTNRSQPDEDPMDHVPFVARHADPDKQRAVQLQALECLSQKTWEHMRVFPIIGIRKVYRRMVRHLLRAEHSVLFGLWSCDFVMPICEGRSLHEYLLHACNKRPALRVSFLLHENILNKFPPGYDGYRNHAQIKVFFVPMFNSGAVAQFLYSHLHRLMGASDLQSATNSSNGSTSGASSSSDLNTTGSQTVAAKNCFHQKWVLFDRNRLLFGGCDLRSSYMSDYPEEPNSHGFFWNDLTLYIHRSEDAPSPDLPEAWLQFLHCNTVSQARASVHSGAIPLPFVNQFSTPWTEEELYVHLIETSTKFIYIENQYLYSSRFSTNRVMSALMARLQRAIKENQHDFRIIWITNFAMKDETSALHIWGLQSSVCSSMLSMQLHRLGSQEVVDRHFWIGYLEQSSKHTNMNDIPIYTHTKWICVDNRSAIHSSSNLCDRSLAPLQSDVELGLVLYDKPDLVSPIQQAMWRAHGGSCCPPSPLIDGDDIPQIEQTGCIPAVLANSSVTNDVSLMTDESSEWDYMRLFAHLRAAKKQEKKFASYCPLDRVLPAWYMVRGVANEIFNTVGRYI